MEYVRRRGGLNVSRRLEVMLGQLMLMLSRFAGDKKSKLDDFMPYERDETDRVAAGDQPADMNAIAALLNSTAGPAAGGDQEE